MVKTVRVNKQHLDYFRKKARQTSKEIQAFLIGHIRLDGTAVVDKFAYPREYLSQTRSEVQWTAREYARVLAEAAQRGRAIIGDIHTHPDSREAILSSVDYESALIDGLKVCGICGVDGKNTIVHFWNPHSALPCEIEYDATT